MINTFVTRFLQHLTKQNDWSRQHLISFANKIVQFDFVLVKANLQILDDGSLGIAADNVIKPDATIHLPPSLALRLMAGDESAKSHIKIDGNTQLAAEFSKVLQNMRWDIEDDLSHFTGDIAAYKMGELSKKAFSEMRRQSINTAEMLSEFLQEEKPMLAKKRHVEQFNADVDTLKNDVARFEKRLQKLIKSAEKESPN